MSFAFLKSANSAFDAFSNDLTFRTLRRCSILFNVATFDIYVCAVVVSQPGVSRFGFSGAIAKSAAEVLDFRDA